MIYYLWIICFCIFLLILPSICDLGEYLWIYRKEKKKIKLINDIMDKNFSKIFYRGYKCF